LGRGPQKGCERVRQKEGKIGETRKKPRKINCKPSDLEKGSGNETKERGVAKKEKSVTPSEPGERDVKEHPRKIIMSGEKDERGIPVVRSPRTESIKEDLPEKKKQRGKKTPGWGSPEGTGAKTKKNGERFDLTAQGGRSQ